jgi:hypothetical protein
MGRVALTVGFALLAVTASAQDPPDPLTQARTLYNQRQFDQAIAAADRARSSPASIHRADLIAARACLERYRESAAAEFLDQARERLRRLSPDRFDARERAEFIVGLGEALYFEESFGAAAEIFESALDAAGTLTGPARERVLDWWAIAVDRDTWNDTPDSLREGQRRILQRMRDELETNPGSATAGYWLAAGERSLGDLQRAWDAAVAGWLRSRLGDDGGEALRAELDQLMQVAIVPELARVVARPAEELQIEWEQFKERWGGY